MRWYPTSRWPLLRVVVQGPSMTPALRHGDWLIALRTRKVRAGQIVLAEDPERPGFQLVKRVARWDDGGWWLASDFPDEAMRDSRHFGPVPPDRVVGRVLVRYWPNPTFFGGLRAIGVRGVPGGHRAPPG